MASADDQQAPVIQVLDKERYFTQALVPLPGAVPYPPLEAPSSLRLRTRVLGLTLNNLTYAKLGFLFRWWDVHPLPPAGEGLMPARFAGPDGDASSSSYGRTNAWGYAEVLASTHAAVPAGSFLWGYVPLGTLAQDLEVADDDEAPGAGMVVVTSPHRARVLPMYNRYFVVARGGTPEAERVAAEVAAKADGPALDALLRVMFEMAYLMNRFVFAPAPAETVHPGMNPETETWTPAMADLADATVIHLAPGSKVGLAFAHELRHGRNASTSSSTEASQPRRIIGAASDVSRAFVERTGFYDAVVPTSADPADLLPGLGINASSSSSSSKVVLIDFGGRGGVADRWAAAIVAAHGGSGARLLRVAIGSEGNQLSSAEVLAGLAAKSRSAHAHADDIAPQSILMNAGDMRDRAMAKVGRAAYFDGLAAAWAAFARDGIPGFRLRWGEGMEDVAKGWEALCRGDASPEEGMAYLL